jgi:hypothetical protein
MCYWRFRSTVNNGALQVAHGKWRTASGALQVAAVSEAVSAFMNQTLPQFARTSRNMLLVLGVGVLSASIARPDNKTEARPFDGIWQTTLSCVNASGALGYSFKFPSSIKEGVLHGQKGTPHEAGWLSIDGPVTADGAADLYVEGLVGASAMAVGQRPAGAQYGYHVAARFSVQRGEGRRVEGRPCTVVFERDK